jgi:hypothetical protein
MRSIIRTPAAELAVQGIGGAKRMLELLAQVCVVAVM